MSNVIESILIVSGLILLTIIMSFFLVWYFAVMIIGTVSVWLWDKTKALFNY